MSYLGTKPGHQVATAQQIADGIVTDTKLASNSVTTAKVLDANITQQKLAANVAGNGPAFSAYTSSAQSFTATALTKLACNTESYDTNNNYDNSAYRFTPTVAGYYQVNIFVQATSVNTNLNITVYKNGSSDQRLLSTYPSSYDSGNGSYLVYLNGSTDYVEAYASWGATQTAVSKFQAFLVRAA